MCPLPSFSSLLSLQLSLSSKGTLKTSFAGFQPVISFQLVNFQINPFISILHIFIHNRQTDDDVDDSSSNRCGDTSWSQYVGIAIAFSLVLPIVYQV